MQGYTPLTYLSHCNTRSNYAAGAVGLATIFVSDRHGGCRFNSPLFASYLFAKYIGKQVTISDEEADTVINQSYEELLKKYGTLPSGSLSLAPIFVPIVLMALGSISKIIGLEGVLGNVMNFLGNSIIALAIGVIFLSSFWRIQKN